MDECERGLQFGFIRVCVPAVLLIQTNDQTNYQGYQASNDNDSYEAYALPPSSSRNIGIVPQIFKFLSFGPSHIPQAILWRLVSIPVSWGLSEESPAERAVVCLRRWQGRRRTGVLCYD